MNKPLTRHFSKSVSSVYIFLVCYIYQRCDQQGGCSRLLSKICVKGIGKFIERTSAHTLLNTPQGCDLCLFLLFCSIVHLPTYMYLPFQRCFPPPSYYYYCHVIIIPPENFCAPSLTLWFICYFPMKKLSPPLSHSLTSSLLTPSRINVTTIIWDRSICIENRLSGWIRNWCSGSFNSCVS